MLVYYIEHSGSVTMASRLTYKAYASYRQYGHPAYMFLLCDFSIMGLVYYDTHQDKIPWQIY